MVSLNYQHVFHYHKSRILLYFRSNFYSFNYSSVFVVFEEKFCFYLIVIFKGVLVNNCRGMIYHPSQIDCHIWIS